MWQPLVRSVVTFFDFPTFDFHLTNDVPASVTVFDFKLEAIFLCTKSVLFKFFLFNTGLINPSCYPKLKI